MDTQNKQIASESSITKEHEERVLRDFRSWYRENQPTIAAANEQAALIASNAAGSLNMLRVMLLLKEHPEWIYQPLPELGDKEEMTIGKMLRIHLVNYLEQAI